ncbi:MAG: hypothetical protein RIQ93_2166 [Verrucomicrobiota bacterium]
MRMSSAPIFVVLFGFGLAGVVAAADSTPLAKSSPFTPAGTPTAVAAADELYEFAGVSTIGQDTTVNIFQKSAKKGRWIAVGASVDGITVAKYDAARDQVVVRVDGGAEKVLALRKANSAAGKAGAPIPAPLLSINASPAALPLPGAATAPVADATAAAEPTGNVTTPVSGTPPPSPTPAAAPGTVAHQEQEARMLVSDLLEIGMAQRKAYEEAQAKASQPNAAPPPGANVPPSAPPQPAAPAQQ